MVINAVSATPDRYFVLQGKLGFGDLLDLGRSHVQEDFRPVGAVWELGST